MHTRELGEAYEGNQATSRRKGVPTHNVARLSSGSLGISLTTC